MKLIDLKDPVKAMCQVDKYVWIALEHGMLLVINIKSFIIEHQFNRPELVKDGLVQMITVDGKASMIALAYSNGSIIFIKSCLKFDSHHDIHEMHSHSLSYGILEEVNFKLENIKFFATNVSSSQLYSIEACKPQDSDQVELWCGCENSIIEIFIPHGRTFKIQSKAVLNTQSNLADVPRDASIIQLKFSPNAQAKMYALYSCGSIISCWNTGKQPVLNTIIKSSQLNSPGNAIDI